MTDPQPDATDVALIVRRTIRATAPRVFAAWTSPEHLRRWWGPADVECTAAEVDLRVGGAYRLANLRPDGTTLWISGEFLRVEPPSRLVYTWRVGDAEDERSRVTVRFEPQGDSTEVVVIHERITTPEIRASHEAGWHGCLDGLADYLASPDSD